MTRFALGLLASGATLFLVSGCAAGPRVTTRYPLAVVGATVDDGDKHVLPVVDNTIIDGSLRIVVQANQAGMIFTVDDTKGGARALVWDEALLRLDADSPRRFRVAPEAQVNASALGEANYMRVSGHLYRQELTPGTPVTAYAPPQTPIRNPEYGCIWVMETEFRLLIPVETDEGRRHYTLTLRPAWYESRLETGVQRCGPVPEGGL